MGAEGSLVEVPIQVELFEKEVDPESMNEGLCLANLRVQGAGDKSSTK